MTPRTAPIDLNVDRAVALGTCVAYAMVVIALLPPPTYAHMLVGALIYFIGVTVTALVLGRGRTHFFSIYIVSVVGAVILLVPNFPAMGGDHLGGVPIGFLGSQAGALLWIAFRWNPESKAKPRTKLSTALLAGAFGAIGISLIASVGVGIGLLSGEAEALRLLWVYPAYFVGAFAAASIYWLLQGIAHRPVGRYLIGAVGGFFVYAAMGPVVAAVDGEPIDFKEMAMIGLVAGCLVGPPVAMSWNEQLTTK